MPVKSEIVMKTILLKDVLANNQTLISNSIGISHSQHDGLQSKRDSTLSFRNTQTTIDTAHGYSLIAKLIPSKTTKWGSWSLELNTVREGVPSNSLNVILYIVDNGNEIKSFAKELKGLNIDNIFFYKKEDECIKVYMKIHRNDHSRIRSIAMDTQSGVDCILTHEILTAEFNPSDCTPFEL